MNKHAAELMDLFRGFSAQSKELLQDVKLRPPDIVFDKEIKLDLGGVTARLFWWGPRTPGRRADFRGTGQRADPGRHRAGQNRPQHAQRRCQREELARDPGSTGAAASRGLCCPITARWATDR